MNLRPILRRLRISSAKNYLRSFFHRLQIPTDRNSLELLRMRNRHRGQKAIIIGNGPSLKFEDIERLGGFVTFASNKIYLAYPHVKWRPTYHLVQDVGILQYSFDEIKKLPGPLMLSQRSLNQHEKVPGAIYYNQIIPRSYLEPDFSTNLLAGVFAGRSVLYSALQMAFYMGIREVFLIGVDHNYQKETAVGRRNDVSLYETGTSDPNHFLPNYFRKGEIWGDPCLDGQEASFRKAGQVFDAAGGGVWNATRGGKLEVLPRVNFDEIIKQHSK